MEPQLKTIAQTLTLASSPAEDNIQDRSRHIQHANLQTCIRTCLEQLFIVLCRNIASKTNSIIIIIIIIRHSLGPQSPWNSHKFVLQDPPALHFLFSHCLQEDHLKSWKFKFEKFKFEKFKFEKFKFAKHWRQGKTIGHMFSGEIQDIAARCELHQPQSTFIFARTLCSCLYSAWTLSLVIGWTILPSSSTLSVYSDATIFCCGTKCLEWTARIDTHRIDTHRNMCEQ